jgi:hypothetical protein
MATARQVAAYREIQAKRLADQQIKTYGMVPIKAKYQTKCGCSRIHHQGESGHWVSGVWVEEHPCGIGRGELTVKFRGAWWALGCVDRVQQEEFKASAKYVLVEIWQGKGGERRTEREWSNDPRQAEVWRRNIELAVGTEFEGTEEVIERQ